MKTFLFKIYDRTGTYLTTWTDVTGEINFDININNGYGELNLVLPRKVNNFGEENDVKLLNELQLWCFDKDAKTGVKIYDGYLSRYIPVLSEKEQYIQVTFIGYQTELKRYIYTNSQGATQITHNSKDPGEIAEDIIDKIKSFGSRIDWDETTLQKSGTVISYTFNVNDALEAVEKVLELCPANWYWYIDANRKLNLHPKSTQAIHNFRIGKEIQKIEPEKRAENIINTIYFTGGKVGGTPLFKRYEDAPSVVNYGKWTLKKTDERITVQDTMDTMAQNILDEKKEPEIKTRITIIDNSIDPNGYDIESIKIGDTCEIRNYADVEVSSKWDVMDWDTGSWDFSLSNIMETIMHIVGIKYINGNKVELEISTRLPTVSKRIEDINRNLDSVRLVDNPSSPSQ